MSVYQDVIMAGFGGQGVILIGNLLAYAGMAAGLNVTFIPVYGPEMRGGTANCTVVLSSDEIGSPIIQRPKAAIVLNQPSLEKFQPRIQDDGVQIVNASLIDTALVDSTRIRSVVIPANDIAETVGGARMVNMVALGAFIKATGVVSIEDVESCLKEVISSHYGHLIPQNAKALRAGYDFA